ncbi:hypothetical protein MRB53_036934 [Persea americana]|nr:hypothetical protein MRB53_036934 [Persea americana]
MMITKATARRRSSCPSPSSSLRCQRKLNKEREKCPPLILERATVEGDPRIRTAVICRNITRSNSQSHFQSQRGLRTLTLPSSSLAEPSSSWSVDQPLFVPRRKSRQINLEPCAGHNGGPSSDHRSRIVVKLSSPGSRKSPDRSVCAVRYIHTCSRPLERPRRMRQHVSNKGQASPSRQTSWLRRCAEDRARCAAQEPPE